MATAFYCLNRSLTNRVTSKPGIFRIQKQIGAGEQELLVDVRKEAKRDRGRKGCDLALGKAPGRGVYGRAYRPGQAVTLLYHARATGSDGRFVVKERSDARHSNRPPAQQVVLAGTRRRCGADEVSHE